MLRERGLFNYEGFTQGIELIEMKCLVGMAGELFSLQSEVGSRNLVLVFEIMSTVGRLSMIFKEHYREIRLEGSKVFNDLCKKLFYMMFVRFYFC